jgi:hypothetical protein
MDPGDVRCERGVAPSFGVRLESSIFVEEYH